MHWTAVVKIMLFSLAIAVQGVYFHADAMESNQSSSIMRISDVDLIADAVLSSSLDKMTGEEMQHCLDVLQRSGSESYDEAYLENALLYDEACSRIENNEKYKEFLDMGEIPSEFMANLDSKKPQEVIEFLLTYARSLDEDAIALCLSVLTKPEDIEHAERIVRIWRGERVQSVPKVRPPGRNVRFSEEALASGNKTEVLIRMPLHSRRFITFMHLLKSSNLNDIPSEVDKVLRSITSHQMNECLKEVSQRGFRFFKKVLDSIRKNPLAFSRLCTDYPQYCSPESTPVALQGGAQGPSSTLMQQPEDQEESQKLDPAYRERFNAFIKNIKSAEAEDIAKGFYEFCPNITVDQMHQVLTRLRDLKSGFFLDVLSDIRDDEAKFNALCSKYPEYADSDSEDEQMEPLQPVSQQVWIPYVAEQPVPSAEVRSFLSRDVTFDRLEKLMQDNPTLYDSVVQRLRSSGELERLNLVTAVDRLDSVRDEMIRLAVGAGRAELAEPKRMSGSRNLTEEGE